MNKTIKQLEYEKKHYEKVYLKQVKLVAKPILLSHLQKLDKKIKQFYAAKKYG